MEVIQLLVEVSSFIRIDRLGLEQWKIWAKNDMEAALKSLTDSQKSDKKTKQEFVRRMVNEMLEKYEKMERTSLLELAVWKAKFLSMQEIEGFDPVEYRRDCRITSGADVIVRGVLRYLG
jgi:hypothetical protein